MANCSKKGNIYMQASVYKQWVILSLCFVFLIMWGGVFPAKAWNQKRIKWHSYSSGLQTAQKTGRPILMVFEAKWCKVCKQYKKVFYNKKVVRLSKKMVMIKIDIQNNRKLQQKYSVDGGYIPRTMAFSPEGYHYANLTGSDKEFKYFLNSRYAGDLIRVMKRAVARAH